MFETVIYQLFYGDEICMAFIIDSYNKYDIWDRAHSVFKFRINDNWYAIKSVELEWGLPQLSLKVD